MGVRRRQQRPPSRVEDLVLTMLCTAAGPLLWWLGTTPGAGSAGSGSLAVVEQSVAVLCAGTGAIIAALWLLALVGVALTACGQRWRSAGLVRLGRRMSPAFLRRVATSLLGVNLLLAPGAWADDGVGPGRSPADAVSAPAIETSARHASIPHPGWLPGRQADEPGVPSPTWTPRVPGPEVPGAGRAAERTPVETATVAVRTGDCLWDIAAEELGPTATDLEIDRRWRQWYQHNRDRIGAEADLLHPGTILRAPPFD